MAVALSHYANGSHRRLDLIERGLQEFGAGRLYEAYLLADMSCRSRVPAPEDVLLRGEIASRLGFEDLADADLHEAFAIDPSLPSAQLRMLAGLQRRGEIEAADVLARAFLRIHPQPAVLSAAIATLRQRPGAGAVAWAQAGRNTIKVHLFCAQQQAFHIDVAFERHKERLLVQTGASHPLAATLGTAASFEIAWPPGEWTVRFGSEPALDWTGPPTFRPLFATRQPRRPPRATATRPPGPVSIVIPVYAGVEQTRACIESVLSAAGETSQRIVLVDDRGPGMSEMLADYAHRPGVALIANPVNLGFIGSVNRALMHLPDGDVVLLNADTIVAPGWLDRLSQAAYSRSDVGTVTPLSNNGELTSVPAPFESSPLPTPGQVSAIDAILARTHRGRTIDLPNGVGFCLYITETCRRATGLLNDLDYEEGYLEEVDFCLRASELGFTHVCACDVFVGHAGGQSFKTRKRGLVKHNLAQLERAFPAIKAMTHRFVRADPLRALRTDLQENLLQAGIPAPSSSTLVIGRQALSGPGEADIPSVAAQARIGPPLRLCFGQGDGRFDRRQDAGQPAMLHLDGAMAPCRLALDLSGDAPAEALMRRIAASGVASILYLDADHPDWARRLPQLLGAQYDVHATDDGILAACRSERDAGHADWATFLTGARSFTTPSRLIAAGFAGLGLGAPEIAAFDPGPSRPSQGRTGEGENVAVFLDAPDAEAWRWLHGFARTLVSRRARARLVVFGDTLDDDGLRRTGVVTVTRRPALELAAATFALHRCGATIALLPEGVCEHRELALILRSPRPILTWNPYIAEVLGCEAGESLSFAPSLIHDKVLDAMMGAFRNDHGRT